MDIMEFLKSVPWDAVLAAVFGAAVGFFLGKFFAEDKGEQDRYEYLSGKKRLRD
jgi:hypothetical protein